MSGSSIRFPLRFRTLQNIPSLADLEASVWDPWFDDVSAQVTSTYYVNGDTGLDANPGTLAQPFRTLTPLRVIPPGIKLVIQAFSGSYSVPTGGLTLTGSSSHPSIIVGTGANQPVLEALPYSISGDPIPLTEGDIRVRQVIDCSGDMVRVENLDIRHGFRHNLVARGMRTVFRNNSLWGAFEDSIKIANTDEAPRGADIGLVSGCSMTGFASQGIDHFGAAKWLFTRNTFSSPQADPISGLFVGQGIGIKGGAEKVICTRNTSSCDSGGIVLGGAGDNFDVSTVDCAASDNTITSATGPGITMPCVTRGAAYRNTINGLEGIEIGIAPDERVTLPNMPFSLGALLIENVITISDLSGLMVWVKNPLDSAGMHSNGNVYNGLDRFGYLDLAKTRAEMLALGISV